MSTGVARLNGVSADAAVGALLSWFDRAGEDLPWRRTRDRYAILVAEIMLQATQVSRVVPRYERWLERWSTPSSLAEAPLGDVLAEWHGLGYPRRARNLQASAARIAAKGWPAPHRLTELPGVGPYTAAALRCFADEEPLLPVDTNVSRVLARRFPAGWPGTPEGSGWAVGQALMDLGRRYCRARAPRCTDGCPLREGCPAAESGDVAAFDPPRRRQGRYEGSMRQRRGRLLGALAEGEVVSVEQDREAAASLIAEGLAAEAEGALVPAP